MTETFAPILSHFSNSGIVQLPGRRFPAIAMQGDTVLTLYDCLLRALHEAKQRKDEDSYYEIFPLAGMLEEQLLHYEQVLEKANVTFPWPGSIRDNPLKEDYDEA